ncbi:unnamed protein product [Parajaminaea phylloscopi]
MFSRYAYVSCPARGRAKSVLDAASSNAALTGGLRAVARGLHRGGAVTVPRVTLFTGTDCSLCDVVKETLQEARKEGADFSVEFYNIRDDSLPDVQRWRRAYQYDIPVVHLDGVEIARHRMEKTSFLAKLRERQQSGQATWLCVRREGAATGARRRVASRREAGRPLVTGGGQTDGRSVSRGEAPGRERSPVGVHHHSQPPFQVHHPYPLFILTQPPARATMSGRQEAFKRYVEVGRVVLINKGESEGKLAVIAEIVDHNKAIVDGPSTGVPRQVIRYRYTTLTPFVVADLPRAAGTSAVKKFFDKSDVAEKWAKSSWAKKRQAQKAKREASDFDRFNIMLLKKQRRSLVQRAAAKQAKA